MFWLALGSALLLWSAFTAPARRVDGAAALGLLVLLALTVGAVRVYPARSEAAALIGGSLAAAFLLWMLGARMPGWTRWAALAAGVGAGLFSLFGPAQGLFP
jgi:hypothetical protein